MPWQESNLHLPVPNTGVLPLYYKATLDQGLDGVRTRNLSISIQVLFRLSYKFLSKVCDLCPSQDFGTLTIYQMTVWSIRFYVTMGIAPTTYCLFVTIVLLLNYITTLINLITRRFTSLLLLSLMTSNQSFIQSIRLKDENCCPVPLRLPKCCHQRSFISTPWMSIY